MFFMCEDGAGQFHHGKATNRIGSTLTSLSGISLAGLLTFLWLNFRDVICARRYSRFLCLSRVLCFLGFYFWVLLINGMFLSNSPYSLV